MPAMTLGNMRANGVRTLAAWCLGRGYAWAGAEQTPPVEQKRLP
jgi:hypothetical protein